MEYNLSIDSHIGPWGYSKNYIRSQMSGFKNKPVNVRISSLGGSVDDALDIRQQFLDHGNVTCYLSVMWRVQLPFWLLELRKHVCPNMRFILSTKYRTG